MGRVFLFISLFSFLLFPNTQSNDRLTELLSELIETDAAGLSYLIDIFPEGEIDFANLKEKDLDKLFFLSLKIRQHLWNNRDDIGDMDELAKVGASATEIELLQICARETSYDPVNIYYYGKVQFTEESSLGEKNGSWVGQRYAQWQKMSANYGSTKLGLSIQKDAGERSIYDAYNGYISLEKKNYLLGMGSFFPSIGTGLLVSPPNISNYKYIIGKSFRNSFRGYNGVDENWPAFGLFTKIKPGKVEFGLSAAKQFLDATSHEDHYTLSQSGYHRTYSELEKINRIELSNYLAFFTLHSDYLKIGTAFNYLETPIQLSFQNASWNRMTLYNSIFAESQKFNFRMEVKTYPGFSFNLSKRLTIEKQLIDFYIYYYDDLPNINGKHIIFNRLPFNSKGANLRWENRYLFGKRIKLSGYILWDNRISSNEKIFYSGINIDYGKKYKHRIFFNNYMINKDTGLPVHRWQASYSFKVHNKKAGSIDLKAGFGIENDRTSRLSRYLIIRYKSNISRKFKAIINFAGWNCEEGTQAWFYTDGLPETFSIFNASGTGTLMHLQLNFSLNYFSFYYAFNKQNRWGENYIGSGSSQIQGSYRSIHYLGLKLNI